MGVAGSRVTAPVSTVVGFAVIPDQPRMFPPVEAIVSQQADPPHRADQPERAVSRVERERTRRP